jgi:hypothetical protein
MEAAGCVFLPATGLRHGTFYEVAVFGRYWSSTPFATIYACSLFFNSNRLYPDGTYDRSLGSSVRLVQDL